MSLLDQILGGVSGVGNNQPRQSGSMGGSILMALLPVVMGMLSQRAGGAAAGNPGGSGGLGGLGGMLGNLGASSGQGGMGNLGSLIEQFTNEGYGQHASSWVGTGPNEALPPQAVSDVLGEEQIAQIAQQAGLTTDDARTGMSELLPSLVDHFTPEGKVQSLDSMSSSVDDFVRRMNAQGS
ncbi:MAG: hypothetical protein JWN41_1767 [Thermoleophilia bacterium]|nr:hypothetical protein [Thermoleophilia bacterium]